MVSLQIFAANEEPLSPRVRKRPFTTLGTLVGVVLLLLAAYVPLLRYNPSNPPTWIYTFSYATSWGIEPLDLIFLVPAGVALATLVIRGPNLRWAWTAVIAGLWTVLLQGLLLLHQYVYTDFWLIPSAGWALAVLGGILLALIGGYTLNRTE